MPEFLQLFGEVTIAQIVTMIIAIGAISGLILKYNSKFDSWSEKRKHNKLFGHYHRSRNRTWYVLIRWI